MYKIKRFFLPMLCFFSVFLANVTYSIASDKPTQDAVVADEVEVAPIEVSAAWARKSLSSANNNSAAYMLIKNNSGNPIEILSASANDVAGNVELHKSFVDEKGVSRMVSIDKILVPAKSEITLEPNGIHIMLFDLKRQLETGDEFEMTLNIADAAPVVFKVEVK